MEAETEDGTFQPNGGRWCVLPPHHLRFLQLSHVQIDTALLYENHREIGEALAAGTVPREEAPSTKSGGFPVGDGSVSMIFQ